MRASWGSPPPLKYFLISKLFKVLGNTLVSEFSSFVLTWLQEIKTTHILKTHILKAI